MQFKRKIMAGICVVITLIVIAITMNWARGIGESEFKQSTKGTKSIIHPQTIILEAKDNALDDSAKTTFKVAKTVRFIDNYIETELLAHAQPQEDPRHTQIKTAIENNKLMFVGNSLVEGLRLNNDSSNQFYCKVGISLSGLKSKIYTQIDNADFDVAIIEMGTNELGGWSEDDFKASYFDLIDHILSNNPSAQVICLSIPPVSANKDSSGTRFNNKNVVKYNSWIEATANTLDQVTYLDCSDFFGDVLRSDWTGDGIHLAGRVYAEWYNHIIDKIGQLYT